MTSLAQARSALVTAVSAAQSAIDPPACYVWSNGSDLTNLGGSNVQWEFRVVCEVGYNGPDASVALDALVAAKLVILWALPGYSVTAVTPEGISTIAGGEYLTASITVTTPVET
jgi:hypothetical protein